MQDLVLLVATGSIGQSSCDLLRRYPDKFRLRAVSAHQSGDELAEIAREFSVERIALSYAPAAEAFHREPH